MNELQLTNEEKELILKKRAEEELKNPKPKRQGFFKTSHYKFSANIYYSQGDYYLKGYNKIMNEEEMQKASEDIRYCFYCVAPEGEKAVSYIEDGQEMWYDEYNGYFEGQDSAWAEEYLENIGPYNAED